MAESDDKTTGVWPASRVTKTLLGYANRELKMAQNRHQVALNEAALADGVPEDVPATFDGENWVEQVK